VARTFCLDCGVPSRGTRCRDCQRPRERQRPVRPTGQGRDWAERKRRRLCVEQWIGQYGPWCPGYGCDGHRVPPAQLTADHVMPVGAGGEQDGPLAVLCRSCNGRKKERTQ
jgi:5-methylcytosine-specific restriction enzyme A